MSNNNSSITVPHPITENMPETKHFFTASGIISLISCLIAIFGLNQLPITYRVIICLSIICLILLINVIFLFIKEREIYYQVCYNIAICKTLTDRVNEVKAENEKLKNSIHIV